MTTTSSDSDLVAMLVADYRVAQRGTDATVDRVTVGQAIDAALRRRAPLLGDRHAGVVVEAVAEVCGLGPFEQLLDDPAITEIMVNGPNQGWIERRGELSRCDVTLSGEAIERAVERMLAPLALRVDRLHPIVDARLADGSRVHVVVPPLAIDGPYVTIRRFRPQRFHLDEFAGFATVELLQRAVKERRSIVVSGATGSGKTSLLGALAEEIEPNERVVTIEDAAELRLPGLHVVRLEARPATVEGVGAVSVRDLVRASLRMRPDRIIVGEVRGAEALDMVQAMSTGHTGSMSTVHANNPRDALRRLELMLLLADVGLPFEAVREQLVRAVDLIVHLERLGDGRRIVAEVFDVAAERADRSVS